MDNLKYGWEVVSQNLVGWIIFGIVFGCVVSFTFGLGIVLMPNALRATRKAILADAAPEVGELFQFDNIKEDAIVMIASSVAHSIGSMLCGVGALATLGMFFFAPYLESDGSCDASGAMRVSLEHGSKQIRVHLWELLVMIVIISVFGSVTMGLGYLVGTPVLLVAFEKYYQDSRPEIYAVAKTASLSMKE